MNIYLKALAAGAFALALSQSAQASTQVRIGVYADAPVEHYSHRVEPAYGYAPGYYAVPRGHVEPAWRGDRHDWRARRAAEFRHREWLRREEWRREESRRAHWRHEHRRDDHRRDDDHRHGDSRGWDGRR